MNVFAFNGRPQVNKLHGLIGERLHLLDGLLIAFLNIDEVIRIIRSEDEPKPVLMQRFGLTGVQADYVLDTKLRQLARLEEMKIRSEQQQLAEERDRLQKILGSKQRLRTLIRKEIEADAETYGDHRRSPIVSRDAAEALDETELAPSEPVTVVLSEKGWARAAKGHEIDPAGLNYKAGDRFLDAAHLRSNQQAIFLDSSGRCYSLQAHTLPSARSQGEPLTGRLAPPAGAVFLSVLGGEAQQWYLISSDAGYGFLVQLKDLGSKNKAGKVLLRLPAGARVLPPVAVTDPQRDRVVAISNEGRMLVFSVTELPALLRGKGNKIIGIPPKRVLAREEFVTALVTVPEGQGLIAYSGKRHVRFKSSDLDHYRGERGRRGNKLPRGFQRVERVVAG